MKILQVLFLVAACQNGTKKKNKKNKNKTDTVHPNYCDYFDLDCETADDSAENRIQRQICCEGYNVTERVYYLTAVVEICRYLYL